MYPQLVRYWFEFDPKASRDARSRPWCGVTAYSLKDAKLILSQQLFDGKEIPPVIKLIENVDVSTLDRGHVTRNMGPPNLRGVWYPRGYESSR
jgi:hypothetical protein